MKNKTYQKIWEFAKPYYQKGRVYDIDQIEWMTKKAEEIANSIKLNEDLLFPIIILHDVGYSLVDNKNPHIKDKKSKKLHMAEGAKIAQEILKKVNYNLKLSEKICHYISVHDNWVFNDNSPYKECIEMALFNDLDFLYVNSSQYAFEITAKSMNMTQEEFYEFWLHDEKLINRPFCCQYCQDYFDQTMQEFRIKYQSKGDL